MPNRVRDKISGILGEFAEQCITKGINWAQNSSTPKNGLNIDFDLRLPMDTAKIAILTTISEEVGKCRVYTLNQGGKYIELSDIQELLKG